MMRTKFPLVGLLPILALVLVVVAWVFAPIQAEDTVGAPQVVPAHTATLACPVQSGLQVVLGQVAAGEEAVALSVPEATVHERWSDAATWRRGSASPGALVLTQTGEASGPVGYVGGSARGAVGGGLLLSRCPSLIDQGWIVGVSGRRSSILQLANLGETDAIVDVSWWNATGPVGERITETIPAGRTRTIDVGAEVPAEDVVAVRVERRRQQVSVIALESGDDGAGTAFVLPQVGLATELVLAGVPDRGSVELAVVNPGEDTAHVSARALGADGAFALEGLDEIVVEPGAIRTVEVPNSTALRGRALHLTSDTPVAANAIVRTDNDLALVTPVGPLAAASAVPIQVSGEDVQLTLSAPQEGATVTLEAVSTDMETLGTEEISIEAGASSVVDLAELFDDAFAVVIRAADNVHAAAWMRSGTRIASTPVEPAPVSVRVPALALR